MLLCDLLWYTERFEYAGWEYTGMDLDEEEEDIAAEAEQAGEEAEEEEAEEEVRKVSRNQKHCISYRKQKLLKSLYNMGLSDLC